MMYRMKIKVLIDHEWHQVDFDQVASVSDLIAFRSRLCEYCRSGRIDNFRMEVFRLNTGAKVVEYAYS